MSAPPVSAPPVSAPPVSAPPRVRAPPVRAPPPCHCETRSAEAIPCLTNRRQFIRQGIASTLRASQ